MPIKFRHYSISLGYGSLNSCREDSITRSELHHPLSPRCPEKHIFNANYADDLGILDDSKDGLQEPTDEILKLGRKTVTNFRCRQ